MRRKRSSILRTRTQMQTCTCTTKFQTKKLLILTQLRKIKYHKENKEYKIEEKTNDSGRINLDEIKDAAFLIEKTEWQIRIIDSGSLNQIANNKDVFIKINNDEKTSVVIANGNKLNIYGSAETVTKTKAHSAI